MTLKSDPNFEEKLTFCLKNDMRNSMNFNSSGGISENLHFDGIFLSKVYNVCNDGVFLPKVNNTDKPCREK